jgi:transcriptional regulator with XRE-family HTH domain
MTAKRDTPALGPFADDLRAYREQAGLSREELGTKLNYSASLIAMIETRGRTPTRKLAMLCDEVFGTPGTFARHERRLRDLPFSSGFRPFSPYEAAAVSLRLFEHTLIPGLLQTEDYARAVLATHPGTTPDEVDERLAARMSRQAILDRDDPPPPVLWVLLDEQVLRRDPGDREIMHEQLAHLADMARRPNITVQVIESASLHAGLMGAFALAETPEMPNIVYLENADDGQTIEDPPMGSKLALQFDALRTEALTGRASIATIEKAADQWRER